MKCNAASFSLFPYFCGEMETEREGEKVRRRDSSSLSLQKKKRLPPPLFWKKEKKKKCEKPSFTGLEILKNISMAGGRRSNGPGVRGQNGIKRASFQ